MIGLIESAKKIKSYGEVGIESNSAREFAWVIHEIVKEDINQLSELSSQTTNLGCQLALLTYAQRTLEVGYIFTEVFLRSEYKDWNPSRENPRVIDLGGDPGLISALYWKHVSPKSNVTVVEANPATANVMRKNIERRKLNSLEVINAVVSKDSRGVAYLNLHSPGLGYHTQDSVSDSIEESVTETIVEVPKITLSSLINSDEIIDLLKVDIEGSETQVIRELSDSGKFSQVEQILMEFHHGPSLWPNNSLLEMTEILDQNGFTIKNAHITSGKGMRKKTPISIEALHGIADANQKVYLTFNAVRNDLL